MNSEAVNAMLAYDREHLWHPYGSSIHPAPVNPVARTEGVFIELADGTRMIDGISSWWCMAHGHNHPKIVAAIKKQLDLFPQVMFAGFTHEPAVELARKLLEVVPPGLEHVFYADSGSIAAEVAIKMALQYQYSTGNVDRDRMLTVRGGYHGDTLGTMALGDPEGMHRYFQGMIPHNFFVSAPQPAFGEEWNPAVMEEIEGKFERCGDQIAGVMLEPVFQGAGGMRFYHPHFLTALRELCDRHGILMIFDEIATGFGRTGKFFAAEYAGVTPDIMCVGKALTGGAITLAATLCTEKVAYGISAGAPGKLMHGPTFMASPLACAAGCASLDLFRETDWQGSVRRIENQLKRELAAANGLPNVADVRVLGAIGVIELRHAVDPGDIMRFLVERGVWLRPFDKYLYTMPPFVIGEEELRKVTAAMVEIAAME